MDETEQIGGGIQGNTGPGIIQIDNPLEGAAGTAPPPDPPAGTPGSYRPVFRCRRR